MSDLLLYATDHSGYCAKVRIVLRAKGLTWTEAPPPGGYRSAAYRALVPAGNLPALRHGDLLLADSEAIAEYLDERFPEPPLLPADPAGRAMARERGRFHDTRLEPALRAIYPYIRPGSENPEAVRRLSAEIDQRLAEAAQVIGAHPDLPFGLGDCGYPGSFAWIEALTPVMGLSLDWPAVLSAYRARIEQQPAVAAELAVLRPVISAWLISVGAA